jgi:hypothetical protein
MKYAFGIFLILHALIHAGYFAPAIPAKPDAPSRPPEFSFDHSWLISYLGLHGSAVKIIGMTCVTIALIGFILAGLGVMGVPLLADYWWPVAIISAFASLIVLIASWDKWFIAAVAINIAIAVYAFQAG